MNQQMLKKRDKALTVFPVNVETGYTVVNLRNKV